MKPFRPGDLVPDCDDAVADDSYDDLVFSVLLRAPEPADLLDAFGEPARPDLIRPLPSG